MNKVISVAEEIIYSTVKITTFLKGVATGSGTGFFTAFNRTSTTCLATIVTNKHVINNCDQIKIICHLEGNDSEMPSGKFISLMIEINENRVIYHPNKDIDLCAISMGDLLVAAKNEGNKIFFKCLDLDIVPKQDDWQYFDAIEEVTMTGCPNGISDEVNNLPIVRKGITASSLGNLYNGKQEFMVDMACFPGSSGSPIFLYDKLGYLDRKTNKYHMDKGRLYLVGILYSGPQITNTGKVILASPPQVAVAAMMHLGYAIRSTELHILDEEIRKIVSSRS